MAEDIVKYTDVYWNTHKKIFSLRESGIVVGYSNALIIENPKFVVQESGRQRVLKEGVKNVHAFLRGDVFSKEPEYTEKKKEFLFKDRVSCDYSFAVYDPRDECGLFRILCVIGDIPITDRVNTCIRTIHAYVHEGSPQLKVKMG